MQENEVWPYEKMVYTQHRICHGERDAQTPLGFWNTSRSPNLGQTTRPYYNQEKRGNLENCGLCCPDRPQSKNNRIWKEG